MQTSVSNLVSYHSVIGVYVQRCSERLNGKCSFKMLKDVGMGVPKSVETRPWSKTGDDGNNNMPHACRDGTMHVIIVVPAFSTSMRKRIMRHNSRNKWLISNSVQMTYIVHVQLK